MSRIFYLQTLSKFRIVVIFMVGLIIVGLAVRFYHRTEFQVNTVPTHIVDNYTSKTLGQSLVYISTTYGIQVSLPAGWRIAEYYNYKSPILNNKIFLNYFFDNYQASNPVGGKQYVSFGITYNYSKNLAQAKEDLVNSYSSAAKPAKLINERSIQVSSDRGLILTGKLLDEEGEDYVDWTFLLVIHQGRLYLFQSPFKTDEINAIFSSVKFI